MDREGFLETIRKQYAEKAHEAYVECEQTGHVDYSSLKKKIDKLMKSAKVEGLPHKEFIDLVQSTLPGDVARKLGLATAVAA